MAWKFGKWWGTDEVPTDQFHTLYETINYRQILPVGGRGVLLQVIAYNYREGGGVYCFVRSVRKKQSCLSWQCYEACMNHGVRIEEEARD